MENENKIVAMVKSPAKTAHLRRGSGFSLVEIKKAEKTVESLKKLNIKIDYFRKSIYQSNVDVLKTLKPLDKKRKKRTPFILKEKKITPYKPKKEKVEAKPVKEEELPPKKKELKPTPAKKEKEKIKATPIKLDTAKDVTEKTLLTVLSGLGTATAKKFAELGVDCVEALLKEDPDELGKLIKGCSSDKIRKWVQEGKELL
ncbi:MAG: hypothetical protein ACTSRI_09055 [Promethearchaeota archaeon]